jgi:hypothetical protein
MMSSRQPGRVTRREVDRWLSQIHREIASVLKGPTGELRARLVLLQRRVARWRDDLQLNRQGGD